MQAFEKVFLQSVQATSGLGDNDGNLFSITALNEAENSEAANFI